MTAKIVLFRLYDCMLSAAGANRIRSTRYAAPLHNFFFFYYVSLIAHLPSHQQKKERDIPVNDN